MIYLSIPIKKLFFGNMKDDYFYACGGFFDLPDKVNFFCKRTDNPVIPIIKDKRIRIDGGTLKNYKMPYLYSTKKKYIIRGIGNIELLNKVISVASNIGKKTNIGFGQCKIKIKSAKEFKLYDNGYIRPTPIDFAKKNNLPDGEIIYSKVRPPYLGTASKEYECYI
jgi:CRISPR type IV-associated protein Csf3